MSLFTIVTGLDRLRIQDAQINNDASKYFIRAFIICVWTEFSFNEKLNTVQI